MSEPLDLDAINERADAATEGPWTASREEVDELHFGRVEMTQLHAPSGNLFAVAFLPLVDAQFMAAARTDVPALVAELRRVRRQNDRLIRQVTQLQDQLLPLVAELRLLRTLLAHPQVRDLLEHHRRLDHAECSCQATYDHGALMDNDQWIAHLIDDAKTRGMVP